MGAEGAGVQEDKCPDDEDKGWASGASFSAHDLEDSSTNNERLFTSKDLNAT